MENPFGSHVSNGTSLRDDAQRRAMNTAARNVNPSPSMYISPCSSDMGSSSFVSESMSAIPSSPSMNSIVQHPLVDAAVSSGATTTTTNTPKLSSPDMAYQARKDWREHGQGLTQALEDKRRQSEHGLMRKPGALVVRVVGGEQRIDLSGAKYTSYVIRVQYANPSSPSTEDISSSTVNNVTSNMVEHRYSEFSKVHTVFKKHGVVVDKSAAFPTKNSIFGRLGDWTPSLTWAPEKHDELVNYRVIHLDCWLVHVVNMYNQGTLPQEAAQTLYEFLVAPTKPPCENNNSVDGASKWNWNNPISFTLGSGIRQATRTVQLMCRDPYKLNQSDQSIPLDLLHAAKGLCFMTVVKAGLVVSGRIGTGVMVARLDDGMNNNNIRWSAPCAIGTVGMGWGAQVGADVTHYLVVLTTTKAVQDLCSSTSVQMGAEMGVAVGPIGRGANSHLATGDWTLHPAYAYAHSQGLFVGMSLEGSVVSVRNDVNIKFYGRQVSAQDLLTLQGPKAAEPLYVALDGAMHEQIPDQGFRPSSLWNANASCSMYQNHPQRPVYTNHNNSSPMPPPIMPSSNCFGSAHNTTDSPPPQDAESMESYHQSSMFLGSQLGGGQRRADYENTRPPTIETMSPVGMMQPLFNDNSPTSTVGGGTGGHHWQ